MACDPKAIANYLLDLAWSKDETLTPMKLQKLVYFAHGWHLALTNKSLLTESVQAWKFGPVIPTLYADFKYFGNQAIKEKARDLRDKDPSDGYHLEMFEPSLDDYPAGDDLEVAKAILNRIYDVYGKYDGLQLSDMTHREGTPWQVVHQGYPKGLPQRVRIPEDVIKQCFRELLNPIPANT